MIRFLHTADWQLGAHLAFLGERSARARDVRLETVERLVALAARESVDFVVVAGDTFDSPDVSDDLLGRLFQILKGLGDIPIYLLPGNHDPARPGGIWERSTWGSAPSGVRPLLSPIPIEVDPGVVLYPCPIGQKTSQQDPTAWIPPREEADVIRIGLAHGGLDRLPRPGNFPIAASRCEVSGLDYLALGDWHSPLVDGRTAYSGAPEPCGFRERDSGHALIVEVLEAGAEPRITRERVAGLVWQRFDLRLDDLADLERLKGWLHESYSELTLDLQLELASPAVRGPAEALVEVLEAEAFFCRSKVELSEDTPLDPGQLLLAAELDAEILAALKVSDQREDAKRAGRGQPKAGGSVLTGSGTESTSNDDLASASPAVLREARRQLALFAQKAVRESPT